MPHSRPVIRFFLLSFLLFAAACHEEGQVEVTGFTLEGVTSIDEGRLKSVLATAESAWLPWGRKRYFDRAAFDADIKRIEAFYADRGFPDARVVSFDVDLNDDQTKVDLTLVIDEGEPVIVEEIQFNGYDGAGRRRLGWLKRRLPQKEGQARDAELLTLSRGAVLDDMRDRGYPHARVRMTERPGSSQNARVVVVHIEPGPRAVFGPIAVHGNEKVSEDVILDQLTFAPGDRYRLGRMQESTRRLYGLELFQFVTIEELDLESESDVVPVRVTVTEGDQQRVRFRVGYGSEEQARATVEYRHVNFLGGARTAGLDAKWSSLDRGAGVTFSEPNLFSKVALNVRGENWFFDQPLYDLETKGGRATLTRRFGQAGPLSRGREVTTISAGYLLEYEDYRAAPEILADPEGRDLLISLGINPETGRGEGWLSALTFDINRNTTENLLDARRGYVLSAHVEKAGLGRDFSYLETSGEVRHYQNLRGRAVIATRLRGATLGGTDTPDEDIPFFKRYFLGGSQGMRGWGRFEVSPLTEDGLPIGGYTSFEGSVELRVPFTENLGAVAFLDGGNVWAGTYDFDFGDLRYAAGGGLRYRTPVGPIRVDVGWQLTPNERLVIGGRPYAEQRRWRVHFSVGQAF